MSTRIPAELKGCRRLIALSYEEDRPLHCELHGDINWRRVAGGLGADR